MHDGIVRTIIDVRHAPKLKKNLIYLGVLDLIGYSFMDIGGALKVTKETMVFMR